MPKALLYVKHYVGYGRTAGAESTAHDLMKALNRAGWDTSVLLAKTHPGVSDYTVDGVTVNAPQDSKGVKHLPFQLFPEQDIILTQLSAAGRAGILASQHNIPSLHIVHNDHLHNEQTSRKYTDISIYNTQWVKDQWSLPGLVVHPAVNPDDYRVHTTREFDVTLINLSKGDDCNYNKGYATFYELARRFSEKKFLAVKGAYGNQHIEQLENVTIWEHQADPRRIYEVSSLVLQPSEYESYGRVAVEGFSSGIPNVSTPLPGIYEALGDSTEYAEFGDYDTWAETLELIFKNYDSYSAKALKRSEFLWKRSQRELEDFVTLCEILATDSLRTAYDYLELV